MDIRQIYTNSLHEKIRKAIESNDKSYSFNRGEDISDNIFIKRIKYMKGKGL